VVRDSRPASRPPTTPAPPPDHDPAGAGPPSCLPQPDASSAGRGASSAQPNTDSGGGRGPRRTGPYAPSRTTLLQSFNHAFEGLVFAFRNQRNVRVHFGLALLVLVASLFFELSRVELLAVFAAVTFVLVAEMFNTALEAAIDLFTDEHDPRAKVAKDLAAGGVLVAAVNALLVAYFVFADKAADLSLNLLSVVRRTPSHLTFVAFLIVVLLVIVLKATGGRGTPLSGGLPSGHAGLAFAGWAAVTLISADTSHGVLLSAVAFIMAALTAQGRVEAGIHSFLEVVLGAVLGVVVTVLLFQLLA
jgi:diacylglycerol kinase (ATP)